MEIKKIKSDQENTFLQNLEKAYTEGIYADTPQNRKLGRVGMSYADYSAKVKKQEEGGEKKEVKEKQGGDEKEQFNNLNNTKKFEFLRKKIACSRPYQSSLTQDFELNDGTYIRIGEFYKDEKGVLNKGKEGELFAYSKDGKPIKLEDALNLIYNKGITKEKYKEYKDKLAYIRANFVIEKLPGRGSYQGFKLKNGDKILLRNGDWDYQKQNENFSSRQLNPYEAVNLIYEEGMKKTPKINPFEDKENN